MRKLKVKWGLAVQTAIMVALIVGARLLINVLDMDVIPVSRMVAALVTGAIFTVAIIFAGTLTDYKESEKIPGELATAIFSLYKEARVASFGHDQIAADLRLHIKELIDVLNKNFDKLKAGGIWNRHEVNLAIDKIDDDILRLVEKNVAPLYVARVRTELSNINRLSNRINVIAETSFIPAAYAISQLAIIFVITISAFLKFDHYYEGVAVVGCNAFLLIGLMLLISDMDNPFEGFARVDLSVLENLEK